MDIKQYIEYFDEIAHLERDKQFDALESAVRDVHAEYRFPILVVLPHIIRLIIIAVFAGSSYMMFGYSIWFIVGSYFIGLIVAKIFITEINDRLILKALVKNIARQ
jgi:hypothetical protein